jgi:hypothetical protein
MKSPRYGWQKRWQVNHTERTAVHDTGLHVQMPGDEPRANNAQQVQQALAVKHGHNAPVMVQRLLKEARILLVGR